MDHTPPPVFKRGPAPLVRLFFFASLSLALLVQAYERRRQCHRVYVAAPHTRNARDVGEFYGIDDRL